MEMLYFTQIHYADGSRDRTKTNVYADAERVINGSPYPEFMAGFTSNLNAYNFDFSFTFQGECGASLYNAGGKFQSGNMRYEDNQTVDQLDRWQNPGDITDVPQARIYTTNGQQDSSRYLEESDFVRLRNVTLGYTFPADGPRNFMLIDYEYILPV